MTMKKHSTFALLLFAALLLIVGKLYAQGDSCYWVYQVVEQQDSYEVTRTHAISGTSETIVSVPKSSAFSLVSIMPPEEITAAETFMLQDSFYASQPEGFVYDLFDHAPQQSLLRQVAPSPDHETVALVMSHYRCPRYPRFECFGVNQIVLVTVATGEQEVLWTLPIQANTPYFPFCNFGYVYLEGTTDTFIKEIRWTPDQKAVLAAINYDRDLSDDPLIVIPLNAPENAFTIGNGEKGWAIAPNSREITALSSDCSVGSGDSISVITFDPNTGQTSNTSYPLTAPVYEVSRDFGIGYFQEQALFEVQLVDGIHVVGDFDRLAAFDPDQAGGPSIIEFSTTGLKRIKSSLSGSAAVVEGNDGLLWQLIPDNDSFAVQQLTSESVTTWQFVGEGELVIQFEGQSQFETVELLQLPIADAGPDQTLTDNDGDGFELVTLDGSGSSDPDGTVESYVWSENDVEIATGVSPQVSLSVGVHTITLTVTDDDGATDTDEVVITVNPPATASTLTVQVGQSSDDVNEEGVDYEAADNYIEDEEVAGCPWVWGNQSALFRNKWAQARITNTPHTVYTTTINPTNNSLIQANPGSSYKAGFAASIYEANPDSNIKFSVISLRLVQTNPFYLFAIIQNNVLKCAGPLEAVPDTRFTSGYFPQYP